MVSTRSSAVVSVTTSTSNTISSGGPRLSKRLRTTAVFSEEDVLENVDEFVVKTAEGKKTRVTKEKALAKAIKKPKSEVEEPDPANFPARVETAWKIGVHVSAAGGVENAVVNAAKLGANAFALFLKSQRQWSAPPLKEESKTRFKERMSKLGYSQDHVLPHGNYLMNLGNPDPEKREKAYRCFVDELKRCEELGLTLYNFHPGSTVGACTIEESLSHIADCINRAHKETTSAITVIENMAGAGNVVGGPFEHIADIIKLVEDKTRVGVCLDTCHMFAAGYDIRSKEGWKSTLDKFDAVIGLKYLRGMHLNDSKMPLGSHKDRHDNIGQGEIGLSAFATMVSDPRTCGIPLILETPSNESDEIWSTEIATLHSYVGDRTDNAVVPLDEAVRKVKEAVTASEKAVEAKKGKKRKAKAKKDTEGDEDMDDDNE